jgi:Regulator of ribonuclease activity B
MHWPEFKDLDKLRDELDLLAKELHGDYDGWEVPATPDAENK